MEEIKIRKGRKEDMASVHRLVMELAEYENASEEVKTNSLVYEKDGFGEKAFFECFVAEKEDEGIIGIAFFYFGYSTWKGKMLYLDDLVVSEKWRRKGIGGILLNRLVAYGHENDVNQIRWHVLDWNEPAIKMYKKVGAELDPEWITCRLSKEQILEWVK